MEIDDPALLDAVGRILNRDGLTGLSISAVAIEADVSRVTLHRRGIEIDALLTAAVLRATADLRQSLLAPLTSGEDAAGRLRLALHVLCEVVERHGPLLSALYHQTVGPSSPTSAQKASFEFTDPFERFLADGVLDGTLDTDDPHEDAEMLVNTVAWTYLHMRRSHRWSARKAADRTIDHCIAKVLRSPSAVG
ncbi:MAG: transcriptional regulator [Ilumatobacteraceae bacterium]|nr:transcriptional regulator [Ilumatobacteraceae bacterium]